MFGQLHWRCGHLATKFIKADSYAKNPFYKEDKSFARISGRAFSFGKQGGLQWVEQVEEAAVAEVFPEEAEAVLAEAVEAVLAEAAEAVFPEAAEEEAVAVLVVSVISAEALADIITDQDRFIFIRAMVGKLLLSIIAEIQPIQVQIIQAQIMRDRAHMQIQQVQHSKHIQLLRK